ncbi:RNB domain-containing ribonuclease [bacterium]|nr:RNB domain-containing ribonuclease [bacterium]
MYVEKDNSKNNRGGVVLFVGISDVSFFVKPNSIIDREALKRGNSTYFPDKVIPMLPEDLSNNLCSLKENSPKKAVVVKMHLDHRGYKIKHEFIRGIITVKKNYTYETFETYLSDNETKKKYSEYKIALNILKQSPHLKNRLNLNLAEKKITFSSEGYPTNVYEKNSLGSNELIEMTMILANLCVSQTLSQSITKYLSRYHEMPDKHALKDLNIFMSLNDLATIREKQVTPNSFNDLLKHCKYPEKKELLSNFILRILPKAKYSDVKAGHFGLNLPSYCHFTSPIRRYADLTVHRSLAFALKWEMDDFDCVENYKAICKIINESEKKSVGAERKSLDRYSALFMSNRLDDCFDGIVSGSSRSCIFIKLKKFPIEGVLLKKHLRFKSEKKRSSFKYGKSKARDMGLSTGDEVRVKLVSVLPYNGSITFSL